jgi:predicted protein tyrosine phosphatase
MPWIANRPEYAIRDSFPAPGCAIISITEARRDPKDLPRLPGYDSILRLTFDDFDPIVHRLEGIIMGVGPAEEAVTFTREHAKAIVAFVDANKDKNLIVHCAAGISRSGAVVEALLQAHPEYEDKGWARKPNGHILSWMKRELGLVPIGYVETGTKVITELSK